MNIDINFRTGIEWQELCRINITAPLGWKDIGGKTMYNNFETDIISREEFEERLLKSVVMSNKIPITIDNKINRKIWKDLFVVI